ncbi:hypothetical protein ACIBHY_36140 [Nonomuraea sp. NPDC050547]|uniref:hypothetical protein n=1 Tax=unclassified Nonomuraea TaxID=2593643 RepID=UPI00378EC3B0
MRCDEILAGVKAERLGLRGMRPAAADGDWSGGEGPDEIRGPAGDLLMVATGRMGDAR